MSCPHNDKAQQRWGPSELRIPESLHAPAVCCSGLFGWNTYDVPFVSFSLFSLADVPCSLAVSVHVAISTTSPTAVKTFTKHISPRTTWSKDMFGGLDKPNRLAITLISRFLGPTMHAPTK